MTVETKTRTNAAAAPTAEPAKASVVDRERALSVTKGLTETEQDLVATILDLQIDGLVNDADGG